MPQGKVRHIVSLSGGKDSTALAIYLRDRIPDLEYVFCDTRKELEETYSYLHKLQAYLGEPVKYLQDDRGFDHYLALRHGYLPSPNDRWCTQYLKLRPFGNEVGNDEVVNYIGIRADEDREGYISHRPNITAAYPFRDAGIAKADVIRILQRSGLGLPEYYRWRSRSGCYFCFFQQKIEWVGLFENHPSLFRVAQDYERQRPLQAKQFTWSHGETLEELAHPGRIAEIKAEHERRSRWHKRPAPGRTLMEILDDEDGTDQACLICSL